MKNFRRLTILTMIALLAFFSVMPSTFSWFAHNGHADGDVMTYSRTDLPLSIKSGTVSMSTKVFDKEAKKATSTSVEYNAVPDVDKGDEAYYETTFTNSGEKDIFVNFGVKNVSNLANFYIGSVMPTVNERTYTAQPSPDFLTSSETKRIYFETATASEFGFQDTTFWQGDTASDMYDETDMNNKNPGDSGFSGFDYDMNIGYYTDATTIRYKCMSKCGNTETRGGQTRNVYYCDIPSSSTKIFFCCKWYFRTTSNQDQNRTNYIENPAPGTLYYLTGKEVDGKVKEHSSTKSVTRNSKTYTNRLLNFNKRYTSVRMAIGQNVNLGLSYPDDYTANSISYAVRSGYTFTTAPTLDKDGVFTAKSAGTGKVRTTIKSPLGDEMYTDTTIEVPEYISELPIMENFRVKAGKSTTIRWYLRNRSKDNSAELGDLYYTF